MLLCERIIQLRKKHGLSQEQLAEELGISRQAVQKWENGSSQPDLTKLVALAKRFDVLVDELLQGTDHRTTEERRLAAPLVKDYTTMHSWELYSSNLDTEYTQCLDEGLDVHPLESLLHTVGSLPVSEDKEQLSNVLFTMLQKLSQRADYPYTEPSDYDGIAALRPSFSLPKTKDFDETALRSKVHGAWMGRICGCLLGKPIEGIHTKELHSLLKKTGNLPLRRYITHAELNADNASEYLLNSNAYVDLIEAAPADDDTNYTVLAAVKLIEPHGFDFTPRHVAEAWIESQPKSAYCTAERVAFKNFVNGFPPPQSAVYKNPFREWIGAQIRGDYFGYICPGNPEKAAELAFRDASISHTKNGIYGEMFVSAMIAAAAVTDDMHTVIRAGLSQIPATSRLYKEIELILRDYQNGTAEATCIAGIHKRYDEYNTYDWCHTISNAAIVVAALLYGGGDYTESIGIAVQAGFDTDCNGATVGSIVGMMKGISAIDDRWTAPIHGRLETSIFGVGTVSIDDMVELTMKHITRGKHSV